MTPDTIDNRSEIVFVYDAVQTNPNGNPMSAENEPRVDAGTGRAVVTDVRLKRYLRDQLVDDEEGVYIKKIDGEVAHRDALATDVFPDELEDELRNAADEDVDDDIFKTFLENAADVRYFGATLSLEGDAEVISKVEDKFPSSLQGPVQFSPASSLNVVQMNDESNSLTSVIATGKGKGQGGYDLADHRLQYAIFPFYAVVNENAAEDTNLTEEDVRRLDHLCWRALKNQTLSRSKLGHSPRLYTRVEYSTDNFHIGLLNDKLSIHEDSSASPTEMRSPTDVTVDVTAYLAELERAADHIETVHVTGETALSYAVDDEVMGYDGFRDELAAAVGEESVREIDVYEEA